MDEMNQTEALIEMTEKAERRKILLILKASQTIEEAIEKVEARDDQ